MPYVRSVRTASGAVAVEIVYSSHRGSQDIEHIGSAHDEAELELLKAVPRQRLAAGQGELAMGLDTFDQPAPPLMTAITRADRPAARRVYGRLFAGCGNVYYDDPDAPVAALIPLSVDGMIVAASTTLLADSR